MIWQDSPPPRNSDILLAVLQILLFGIDVSQKSIDAYANGHVDSAASHYEKALESYDAALDLIQAY